MINKFKKNSEIDVVLVSPPSRMLNHFRPPFSLMYVAEWYRAQGKTVKIIDLTMDRIIRDNKFLSEKKSIVEEIRDKTINEIKKYKPKLVGISCYSPEFDEVKDLISRIKYPIIVGGIHPTLKPDDFKNLGVSIHKGRADVNQAAWDLIDMEYYTTPNPYAIRGLFTRSIHVMSGIGCPSQCKFCVAPTLRKYFGIARYKTPKNFAREIKLLKKKYEFDSFYIVDDLFTMEKNYVKSFCGFIKNSRLIWGCQAKVPTLDDDLVKAMAKSGCIQIDFGIERASNREFERIGKGQTMDQVMKAKLLCKKYKIRTLDNYLINISKETKSDFNDIENLIKKTKPTIVSVNVYSSYPGNSLKESNIPRKKMENYALKLNRKYNSVWHNFLWHFSWRYLKTLIYSKRKLSYIHRIGILIQEIINQKGFELLSKNNLN